MSEKESTIGVQWELEDRNPLVYRYGEKLGQPRFPLVRCTLARVGISLSPLNSNNKDYLNEYAHARMQAPGSVQRMLGCYANVELYS